MLENVFSRDKAQSRRRQAWGSCMFSSWHLSFGLRAMDSVAAFEIALFGLRKCSPSAKKISLVTRDCSLVNVVSCVSISADCSHRLLYCWMWRSSGAFGCDQFSFACGPEYKHTYTARRSSRRGNI